MKFVNIASLLSFGTIVFSTTLPSGSIAHPINQSADIFPSNNSNNNNQLDNGIFNNINNIQYHDVDPDFNKYPNKPTQSNNKANIKWIKLYRLFNLRISFFDLNDIVYLYLAPL